MKAILKIDMPKTCDRCPLFINKFLGIEAFCAMNAKYTRKEIAKEADGNLMMYYDGCLSNRPKACPLEPYDRKEEPQHDEKRI